jgi:ribonucleotide monophosphatase NagD (HAD superfamily)
LPGARRLIDLLNESGKSYFILTNDASRLPQTSADLWAGYGMAVDPKRIVTSGSLLPPYFEHQQLCGSRCVVMGPRDSAAYVRAAGGRVVTAAEDFQVLVLGDESGYPFLDTTDAVLTTILRRIDEGKPVHLLLPNPDLIYPKANGGFGIAGGCIALMLEAALAARHPCRDDLLFQRLGKPRAAMFEEALRRSGSRNAVMVGDQVETDIHGALACGIDAALVTTGVSGGDLAALPRDRRPTYLLESLER